MTYLAELSPLWLGLKTVLPFAGGWDPSLRVIRVRVSYGGMRLDATDRHTSIQFTIPNIEGDDAEPIYRYLPAGGVKALLKGSAVDWASVTVGQHGISLCRPDGTEAKVETCKGYMPDLDDMYRDLEHSEGGGSPAMFDPRYIARLGRLPGNVWLSTNEDPLKPLLFTVTAPDGRWRVRGAIMPIKGGTR